MATMHVQEYFVVVKVEGLEMEFSCELRHVIGMEFSCEVCHVI